MMLSRAFLVCVLAHACVTHSYRHKGATDEKGTVVTVTPSGEIRGAFNHTRRGRLFESYRGIRYAEPPVGELRFQPPRPILNYAKTVDATKEGPACPYMTPLTVEMNEDCLTINVYTPPKSNRTGLLPVVFFIHPGGFYSMTGRSDRAGPHYLLDKDLVLVTINYRLGSLGFLSTGDELAPGNNGFKDQVVALRWVERNIAAFGGDPNLVTIAGCSAGSSSVALHMVSPMSRGLFHRAISMSGSPTKLERSPDNMWKQAMRQAQILNCPTHSSQAIVVCLKTKPWKEFESILGFLEFGADPVSFFTPVVEKDFGQERFLTVDPTVLIREGNMHAVPYIISLTRDEFAWKAFHVLKNLTLLKAMNEEWDRVAPISFQLPRNNPDAARRLRTAYFEDKPIVNDEASAKALGRLYADGITAFPVHRLANLIVRSDLRPVWYMQFSYVGNNSHYRDSTTRQPIGVVHHDDLLYLFTMNYRFPTIPLDSPDSVIVDKMTAIWYNFAKYGDPNYRGDQPELSELQWPPMKLEHKTYLRVDKDFSLHKDMYEDRFKLWEELYPMQY